MARTNTAKRTIARVAANKAARDAVYTKLAEHDTALDALEGGTTASVVTIHPVRAASTANVANLAAFTVANDGVTLVAGNRVLLKDQSTASQNGIYVVGTVGTGTAALTRATDFDAAAEVKPQTIVAVAAGTANGNTLWELNLAAAPTVGSTSLPFVQVPTAYGQAPVRKVRAVTTSNVGAFTSVSTTLDGLTLVAGDRILVSAESTGANEGIYVVGTVDGVNAPWTRATDWAVGQVIPNGTIIVVDAGTAGANRVYKLSNASTITVGSTDLTFERLYTSTELLSTATGKGASLIGIYDTPDKFTATNVESALAEVKTLVDAGMTASKRTVTINDEDAAVTGATCTIPLITGALPANAIVFAHELNIVEQFAGLSDVTMKLGGTDDDAIVAASQDLDGMAPGRYQGTLGAHPQGYFGGETLNVKLTSAGGDLATLSAGQMIVTVWYFVLA